MISWHVVTAGEAEQRGMPGPLSAQTLQIIVELVCFQIFGGAHGRGMLLNFLS